jgi:hypothetical protein
MVYDAGALVAAERGDRRLWADHRVRLEQGMVPIVPAPVVAQVSRSPRQVQLRRLLRGCDVALLDEDKAHRIGVVLARSGTADVVDGAVVAEAVSRWAPVLTGDRGDIASLLQAMNADIAIVDV